MIERNAAVHFGIMNETNVAVKTVYLLFACTCHCCQGTHTGCDRDVIVELMMSIRPDSRQPGIAIALLPRAVLQG